MSLREWRGAGVAVPVFGLRSEQVRDPYIRTFLIRPYIRTFLIRPNSGSLLRRAKNQALVLVLVPTPEPLDPNPHPTVASDAPYTQTQTDQIPNWLLPPPTYHCLFLHVR